MHRTTKSEFEYFKKRVYFWQGVLGITWLDINVDMTEPDLLVVDATVTAEYNVTVQYGSCFIGINKELPSKPSLIEFDRIAFHEVFEAGYFSRLRNLALGTYSSFEVEAATHEAVRAAENTIFYKLRGGK